MTDRPPGGRGGAPRRDPVRSRRRGRTLSTGRALSTVTSYVLTLAIVTLLGTGLFIATNDLVGDERQRAIRTEFDVAGNRLASGIATADRMTVGAEGTTTERVRLTVDLPEDVAGSTYLVRVGNRTADGRHRIVLNSTHPEVSRTVWVKTRVPVEPTTVEGGRLVVVYDPDSGSLEVRHAG